MFFRNFEFSIWFLAIIFFIVSMKMIFAEEREYYRVSMEKLKCVKQNVDKFRQFGDPALIDLHDCPPNQTQTSLLGNFTNEMINTDRFVQGEDTILALTSDELDCLENLILPVDKAVLLFYPVECTITSE